MCKVMHLQAGTTAHHFAHGEAFTEVVLAPCVSISLYLRHRQQPMFMIISSLGSGIVPAVHISPVRD